MRWHSSSNVSRSHSRDAKSTPTRTKQGGSAPASNVVRLVTLLQIVLIKIGPGTRKEREEGEKEELQEGKG
jgi:hypothetical protein